MAYCLLMSANGLCSSHVMSGFRLMPYCLSCYELLMAYCLLLLCAAVRLWIMAYCLLMLCASFGLWPIVFSCYERLPAHGLFPSHVINGFRLIPPPVVLSNIAMGIFSVAIFYICATATAYGELFTITDGIRIDNYYYRCRHV